MLCNNCGIRKKQSNGLSKNKKSFGNKTFKTLCTFCSSHPNIQDKATITYCRVCKSKYHPSQLDLDHIDGNSKNNKYENYQIICSNCHRLKTYMCKDTLNKEYK